MKLNDSKTAHVAEAVSAVLSGKGKEYSMDRLHTEALEINESIKSVEYDTVVEDAQEEMDPRDHVSEKDGKFVVVNSKGEEVKSFDNKEEAEEYAVSNHDSLMKEATDLEEASKLSSKEEAMVLKVVGSTKTTKEAVAKVAKEMKLSAKEAAVIVKELMDKYESVEADEADEEINEAKEITIKVPWNGPNPWDVQPSWPYMVNLDDWDKREREITISGPKREIEKWFLDSEPEGYGASRSQVRGLFRQISIENPIKESNEADEADEEINEAKVYAQVELWNGKKIKRSFKTQSAAEKFVKKMQDEEDVRGYNLYAESNESSEAELSEDDKAAYKAFFAKAMKKFGIDDITDLKGDKKKEFFDYVDANWKAKDE